MLNYIFFLRKIKSVSKKLDEWWETEKIHKWILCLSTCGFGIELFKLVLHCMHQLDRFFKFFYSLDIFPMTQYNSRKSARNFVRLNNLHNNSLIFLISRIFSRYKSIRMKIILWCCLLLCRSFIFFYCSVIFILNHSRYFYV